MKLAEVTLYENKSHRILKEGWHDLTESQQNVQIRFERELFPLLEQYTKLSEQTLTKDQVLSLFKGAEETAMAGGDNTTIAGKVGKGALAAAKLPVDIAKKVDAKINELGRMAQQAGPIKNADQKFEQLKKDIKAKNSDSKIVQGIEKISDWAKENPGKATLAVGILTTIAAFAGGPAGGAAAGLVLRASKDLLQGEKLSNAVGKSVKTAAYGALAGAAFKYISGDIVDNIATAQTAELDAMEAAMKAENFATAKADLFADLGMDVDVLDGAVKMKLSGNLNAFYYNYDSVIPPDMMSQYNALESAVSGAKSFSPEHYAAAGKFHDFMGQLVKSDSAKDLTAAWNALSQIPKDSIDVSQLEQIIATAESGDVLLKNMTDAGGAIAAAAQGALATVDDTAKDAQKAKPIPPEEKKQLELDLKGGGEQGDPIDKNFNKNQKLSAKGPVGDKAEAQDMLAKLELYLAEADPAQGELGLDNPNTAGAKAKRGLGNLAGKVGGAFKGAASKAKGAVAGAASKAAGAVKQGAKDLGNKVTANKLMKAWQGAGEPLDTGSVMNIMQDAGMTTDQIGQVGQSAKIDLKPAKAADASPQVDANKDGNDDATGEPIKAPADDTVQTPPAAVDANKDGNDDATGKPMPKATGGATQAPPASGINIKALAAEIQKAGPEIIALVKVQLADKTQQGTMTPMKKKVKTGGKVPGQVSQTPNAIRKRNARAATKQQVSASIENEVNSLIAELDRVLH
tara:strand:- start:201 stop:2426 length:2226 start_codon:yes stop_codon:yes gene_type:complete